MDRVLLVIRNICLIVASALTLSCGSSDKPAESQIVGETWRPEKLCAFRRIPLRSTPLNKTITNSREPVFMPFRLTTPGHTLSSGDLNGDDLEDFLIGGEQSVPARVFLQDKSGSFAETEQPDLVADADFEDGGIGLADVDQDGDLDVYVSSGGWWYDVGSQYYQDRLYLNDGSGSFSRSNLLPGITSSSSAVVPMDFDSDGDTDFFVGARIVPGSYGRRPQSLLLRNDNGSFKDIGPDVLPEEGILGMVTDAIWVNLPSLNPQLVIAGEWMRIRILQWEEDHFIDQDIRGLDSSEGMWTSLEVFDITHDAYVDIIAGNCGLNPDFNADFQRPMRMLVADFDGDGIDQRIITGYSVEQQKESILLDEVGVSSHPQLSTLSLAQLTDDSWPGSEQSICRTLRSGYFANAGGGLEFHAFNESEQQGSVSGFIVSDFNEDGVRDLLIGGIISSGISQGEWGAFLRILFASQQDDFFGVNGSDLGLSVMDQIRSITSVRLANGEGIALTSGTGDPECFRVVKEQ